ncbi:MAG: DNRLRE domain-containing protein [candidate division KSB1 bacterium]|nr:DNRLRE domain-containing protein [candidate division KSB1 bacterium]
MRHLCAAIGVAMVVFAIGCTRNEKLPYGIALLDRVDVGGVKQVEISPPVAEATYERGGVTTGKSPFLLVGQAEGYRTAFVVRFAALPDSSVVDRATLWLSPASYRGEPGQVELSVHQVVAGWGEESVTWDSLVGTNGPQVGWGTVVAGDSLRVGLSIDPALVQAWIDSTAPNYGLYVTGTGQTIVEFHSRQATDTTRYPKLELSYVRKGAAGTTLIRPDRDAFLVTHEGDAPQGRLMIANGTGWRILLKFSLDSIPRDATINRARLELWLDQTSTKLRETGMAIAGRPVVSDTWDPASIAVDTTMSVPVAAIVPASEKIAFSVSSEISDFTAMVQAWTSGRLPNRGLMLYSTGEGLDISEAVVYASGAVEARPPRLLVEYTLPPRP